MMEEGLCEFAVFGKLSSALGPCAERAHWIMDATQKRPGPQMCMFRSLVVSATNSASKKKKQVSEIGSALPIPREVEITTCKAIARAGCVSCSAEIPATEFVGRT